MIYGDRLSMDDTVRNTTVCDGTVDNAYAHRLAHLFSLSIAVYPSFSSFPVVPLSVKVRISRHVRIHTILLRGNYNIIQMNALFSISYNDLL